MSNEATPTEGNQEPTTIGESTPSIDLGSEIRNAADAPEPTDANEVARLTKMVEHFQGTQGRMSGELGELRAEKAARVDAAETSADDDKLAEMVYSDPKGFAAALAAKVEAQVQARLAPVVQPVEHMNVVNTVQDGNELARRLIADPGTNDYLQNLSNDPDALATFEDPKRNRYEAALFRRISALHGQQEVDRANPPTPPRPEAAGAASPGNQSPGGGTPPAASKEAGSLEEGVKAFTEGMQSAGHRA